VHSTANQMVNSAPNQMLPGWQEDFDGVASRYSPVLFRMALRRLRNVEDAEDAVQDALLSAYKHIGQFEGRSQLSSWLTRIVINTAGMKLRKRGRQEFASIDQSPEDGETGVAVELADAGPNPENICAQRELEETVRRALAQISPKLRVTFQMREVAGYSMRETADALGITPNTAKSRVKRARTAIGLYLKNGGATRRVDEPAAPATNRSASDPRQRRKLRRNRARFAGSGREFAGRQASLHGRSLSLGRGV
jgi:RNA polymerase sigma-70 factor, ECF subfamily